MSHHTAASPHAVHRIQIVGPPGSRAGAATMTGGVSASTRGTHTVEAGTTRRTNTSAVVRTTEEQMTGAHTTEEQMIGDHTTEEWIVRHTVMNRGAKGG